MHSLERNSALGNLQRLIAVRDYYYANPQALTIPARLWVRTIDDLIQTAEDVLKTKRGKL